MSQSISTSPSAGMSAFSVDEIRRRMSAGVAQKAADKLQQLKEQEEKQKAIIAEFHKPSERTLEQLMQMVTRLVNDAADRGETEAQIYRFPNALCTDAGRRITVRLAFDLRGAAEIRV